MSPAQGQAPEKVTTDGHDSYPRALRETLGLDAHHRTSRSMNNRIEQDNRGIKQRYYPMREFGSFDSAARFCTAHDELRAPSARAPASTTPSPLPSNAACSKNAGVRYADLAGGVGTHSGRNHDGRLAADSESEHSALLW